MKQLNSTNAEPVAGIGNLLTSTQVMGILGYRNRPGFFQFCRAHGVPHIRLNARRIMFDANVLNAWLASRSTASK